MRNPARSATSMPQSEAQGVHNVHTFFCPLRRPQQGWL